MPRTKIINIVLGATIGMGLLGFAITFGYGLINAIFTERGAAEPPSEATLGVLRSTNT